LVDEELEEEKADSPKVEWRDKRIHWEFGVGEADVIHTGKSEDKRKATIVGGSFPWWYGYARRMGIHVAKVYLDSLVH
jgi:hypothetical protein